MRYITGICTLFIAELLLADFLLTSQTARASLGAPLTFAGDPSSNSKHFVEYVQRKGGTVSVIDFSSETAGPLPPDAYVDLGVMVRGTNGLDHITNSRGPGQGGETEPRSTGEGPHALAAYVGDSVGAGRVATLTVSFARPVMAAGLDTIDLDSSTATENAQLAIYSGPNGSGDLLASYFAQNLNFQQNNLYFMGLASDRGNVRSLVFTSFGKANDRVGIADIRYARAPISSTWLGIAGVAAIAALSVCGIQLRRRVLRRRRAVSSKGPIAPSDWPASQTHRVPYKVEDEHGPWKGRSAF